MNVAVLSQKRVNPLGLMRRKIVGNDVDLFALGLIDHNVGQKGDEFGGGVPVSGLAQDFTGLGIESGVQGQRAVAEILETVAFGASRRHGNTGSSRSKA